MREIVNAKILVSGLAAKYTYHKNFVIRLYNQWLFTHVRSYSRIMYNGDGAMHLARATFLANCDYLANKLQNEMHILFNYR